MTAAEAKQIAVNAEEHVVYLRRLLGQAMAVAVAAREMAREEARKEASK